MKRNQMRKGAKPKPSPSLIDRGIKWAYKALIGIGITLAIIIFSAAINPWLGFAVIIGSAFGWIMLLYRRIKQHWNHPQSKKARNAIKHLLRRGQSAPKPKQIKSITVQRRWRDAEFAYKIRNHYMFFNTAGVAMEKAVLYAFQKRNGQKKTSTKGAIDNLIKHKYFSLPAEDILRAWNYRNQYSHESGVNGKAVQYVDDRTLRQFHSVVKHVVDRCLTK